MTNRSVQILKQTVYRGPNLYSFSRGILLDVDIADLELEPSAKIPGFNANLLKLIPTLQTHTCSYDEEGGFVRRLTEDEGTWMGHIMEHIAIEIQNLAGVSVSHGKTRQIQGEKGKTGKESIYRIFFEYRNEETALASAKLALRTVNYLVDNTQVKDYNYKEELVDVIETAEEYAYGPSTGSIVNEAHNRGIPSIRLRKPSSLVQFGWGVNQKRIWASTSTMSGYISVEIAQDKELTLQMLYDVGIPVPRGGTARTLRQAIQIVYRIGYPVVVKPLNVSHGRGITLNIMNEEDLERGYEFAKDYSKTVIIEKFLTGKDFRILVINGQFIAAANRVPAHVVGDGKHTIQQLVDITNEDPRRGIGHEKVLTKIKIDQSAEKLLSEQKLTVESIPEAGKFIQLQATANLSTGGSAIDVSEVIHYDNIKLAERAVKTIGLDIAGVDIIAPDITKPIKQFGGGIVEINAAPGLRMHLEPTEGTNRNVAKPIIDMLFPNGSDGRIPLVAITGTNGKTTTSRWIAHTLKLAGYKVGLTTTDGIYIDGEPEFFGDCTGPWSAKVVLRDPTVDFAVLETARGGIVREGLGWDFCDVGMILNVSDDHLGRGGVETIEDLAEVKGVILDQVSKTGWGILNADDALVMRQRDRIDGEVVLVSLDYQNPILVEHVGKEGKAVTVTPNGMVQVWQGGAQIPVIHVRDIPATFKGRATFNLQNAMFVVAACLKFISVNDIKTGLATFYMDRNQTPGRMNIERLNGTRIIIDYGHNKEALKAQAQLVQSMKRDQGGVGRTAIVFSMPGDRPNASIIEAVKGIAGQYDRYFLKEDWRLRGRNSMEIPMLIENALKESGVKPDQIEIHAGEGKNELDAITSMYNWMQHEDIIMLQADDISKVQDHLFRKLANIKTEDLVFSNEPSIDESPTNETFDFAAEVKVKGDEFSD